MLDTGSIMVINDNHIHGVKLKQHTSGDFSSGWWFGCHFLFSHILGIIIPIDFHIFQRGSNHQPDMVCFSDFFFCPQNEM